MICSHLTLIFGLLRVCTETIPPSTVALVEGLVAVKELHQEQKLQGRSSSPTTAFIPPARGQCPSRGGDCRISMVAMIPMRKRTRRRKTESPTAFSRFRRGRLRRRLLVLKSIRSDGYGVYYSVDGVFCGDYRSVTTRYPIGDGGYRLVTIWYPIGGGGYWSVSRWILDGNQLKIIG
ncbi:hypothetical protein TIFTF001_032098 [Ficus carica]|uniref:Uncharacterized protein n=1 Tax=Ficus carica TaxID=3494 RepID=A0AA88J599_FICCA|nr:hypothetical protein TIFTF001_032098 [Ficus carica]